MKIFDVTLDSWQLEAADTEQAAINWATGFVFMECETYEGEKPADSEHVATVQGDIDVYYCVTTDHFWFAQAD